MSKQDHRNPDGPRDDDDGFALRLERVDRQLVGETRELQDDPAQEPELEGAKRVLGLINRVRERDADTDGDGTPDRYSGEAETLASDRLGRRGDQTGVSHQRIGSYEILGQIARGGMGVVFRARDPSLNRLVALKMMLAGPFAYEDEKSRFRIEAEAAAGLDHPGIVPVYEVGQHEGQPFFTMGLVEGDSLAQRIADEPLEPRTAADLARRIAAAAAYAHDQGVIHRDIKPANVLMDRNGRPRLTDFGLARRINSVSDLTGTEQVLGTPSYMAPEQASGGASSAGELADVYSIGATLYCMITGRPPFQGHGAAETVRMVLDTEPVAPRQLNPAIPIDLNTICLKCLQKDPHRRYAGAAELEADLQRFIDHVPIKARPIGLVERSWKWSRRHPVIAGLSAAVALAAVTLIAGGIWYQTRLNQSLAEVKRSRASAVDSLYHARTSEAEFLGEIRPLGYGPRVERLIAEAQSLDTDAKDPNRLRQLLVNSLGHVGAREPIVLDSVDSTITAANVLPGTSQLIVGLRSGRLVLFDLDKGQKISQHQALSVPVVRIDVDALDPGTNQRRIRVVGQGCREMSWWIQDDQGHLEKGRSIHPSLPADFYAIQATPNGKRIIGVSPAPPELARPDAWFTPATRVVGSPVDQGRRGDRANATFAVASLEPNQGWSVRQLPTPAMPRFDINNDYLLVGRSWMDDPAIDDDLQVYDLSTGEIVHEWNASVGALRNVLISPQGRYIACAGNFGVEVFRLSSGQRVGKYDGLGKCTVESFIGIDGDVLVRTQRDTVWLSHRHSQPIARMENRDDGSRICLSTNHRYAIWLGTSQPRVVDLRGRERIRINAHDRIVESVSFSPDAQLLLSTGRFYGGNVTKVWNGSTGEQEFEFTGDASTFSPDGNWIAAWSGRLQLWDVATGTLVTTAECDHAPARIAFSEPGNMLAAIMLFPGQSQIWRIERNVAAKAGDAPRVSLQPVQTDPRLRAPVAFSPSGRQLAFFDGEAICMQGLQHPKPSRSTKVEGISGKDSIAFLDEDRLLIAAQDLLLWDLSRDRIRVTSSPDYRQPVVVSPDRTLLFTQRQLLQSSDLQPVFRLPGWVNSVASVAWSRDGRRLAFGLEGGDIALWDLQSVTERLDAQGLPCNQIMFDPSEPLECVSQMIQIGRQHAGSLHADQWRYDCQLLSGWLEDGAIEHKNIIRRVRRLSEQLDRVDARPFFETSESDSIWQVLGVAYDLSQRLQQAKEYDAQLMLLQSMGSAVERLRPHTPETLRRAGMIYHSLGDVLNFNCPDHQRCLEAYQVEQRLLSQLLQHAQQPQTRDNLAGSLFWLDRNRALAHERTGDTEKAIESMNRALLVREEFPHAQFDRATVSRGYESLIRWLAEAGREAEAQEVRRRKHAILPKTDE